MLAGPLPELAAAIEDVGQIAQNPVAQLAWLFAGRGLAAGLLCNLLSTTQDFEGLERSVDDIDRLQPRQPGCDLAFPGFEVAGLPGAGPTSRSTRHRGLPAAAARQHAPRATDRHRLPRRFLPAVPARPRPDDLHHRRRLRHRGHHRRPLRLPPRRRCPDRGRARRGVRGGQHHARGRGGHTGLRRSRGARRGLPRRLRGLARARRRHHRGRRRHRRHRGQRRRGRRPAAATDPGGSSQRWPRPSELPAGGSGGIGGSNGRFGSQRAADQALLDDGDDATNPAAGPPRCCHRSTRAGRTASPTPADLAVGSRPVSTVAAVAAPSCCARRTHRRRRRPHGGRRGRRRCRSRRLLGNRPRRRRWWWRLDRRRVGLRDRRHGWRPPGDRWRWWWRPGWSRWRRRRRRDRGAGAGHHRHRAGPSSASTRAAMAPPATASSPRPQPGAASSSTTRATAIPTTTSTSCWTSIRPAWRSSCRRRRPASTVSTTCGPTASRRCRSPPAVTPPTTSSCAEPPSEPCSPSAQWCRSTTSASSSSG